MMSCRRHLVELFYDVLSPYSYISFKLLNQCSKQWKSMDLQLRPVLVGGIFKEIGNQAPRILPIRGNKQWNTMNLQLRPVLVGGIFKSVKIQEPLTHPTKGRYMFEDLDRISGYYRVPFRLSKNIEQDFFAKGSVKAQRLLTYVQEKSPDLLNGISDEIFKRIWVDNIDISEKKSLREACEAAGLSSTESSNALDEINHQSVKEGLKKATSYAIECGVFGTPTYILHRNGKKDMLFGTDRIFLLAHYLNEPWPVFPNEE
ncbi:glutathione S-transferase kappa 1-like isoform X1 [Styela clava]